jgi:hypothetical protein
MLLIAAAQSDINRHLCPADSLIKHHTSSALTASVMRLSARFSPVGWKGARDKTRTESSQVRVSMSWIFFS